MTRRGFAGPSEFELGAAVTDASGKAKLKWVVTPLAQGNYTLKATFAADEGTGGATAEGNLFVSKGITAFELGTISCGAYKNEPGQGHCSVLFSLHSESVSGRGERCRTPANTA